MNLIFSQNFHLLVKVCLFLLCNTLYIFSSVTKLGATPIQSDIEKVNSFISNQDYDTAIAFSSESFQKYMDEGNTAAAYSMLIHQLDCLNAKGDQEAFLEVSNKISNDLNPAEYTETIRSNFDRRCLFFMMRDEAALEKEYLKWMDFEKNYGTDDTYVYSVLTYLSRRYPKGDERNQADIDKLVEIKDLVKSRENKMVYYNKLGKRFHMLNQTKADSFFRLSIEYVDACLLYTSPSPRDQRGSRMPSSA